MRGADLLSIDALTDLENALGRFGSRSRECLEIADLTLRRQLEELASRRSEAEHQVRVCESNCTQATEDEAEEAERRLQVAKERLWLVRRWQGRAEEAAHRYRAAAIQFQRTTLEQIPKAQQRLRLKQDEGATYLAFQMAGDRIPSSRPPTPTTRPAAPSSSVETPSLDNIVSFPLPPGFRWVSLEHLSPRDELSPDEGFKKVSESEMRRGFGILRRQVLPYLMDHPHANGQTFLELDGWATEGGPNPRQRAYDAFFGDEPIVLDGPRPDGTFGITSGRHRIKVARDLGWTAIPVKVTGERR